MPGWTRGLVRAGVVALLAVAALLAARPYVRAAALVARVAQLEGPLGALARAHAASVTTASLLAPTRHGDVPARVYEPSVRPTRTIVLIPGIHSMGIEEPRLTALASALAGSGVRVVTVALPDLTRYVITPDATDVAEDIVRWAATRADWAPDGRVGVIGISFAGGLAIVAAARPSIANHVAFVLSFGGHADLPRVLHYLATGVAPAVGGLHAPPPHDYGLAVLAYGLAADGLVPAAQAVMLQDGIRTFLLASQLTLVNEASANDAFARARQMADSMPVPARSYMGYVNTRNVIALGHAVAPLLDSPRFANPAVSPARTADTPHAPVYLLHGDADSVIPTAESLLLAEHLRPRGVAVHLLISHLITHAELNQNADAWDVWTLVAFWASVLQE